ncbi:MAG: phage tail assembly chaperone [Erythrobacter sp.]|jgi:hypothetical protein|nr:phage tail assembly chaperone [Erythrobacter sp.]
MSDFRAFATRANAICAQLLGWCPDEFWEATPAELALALGDTARSEAAHAPTRDLIARMMERDTHGQ